MSFTSEIKEELFQKENVKTHCKTAELSAYINNLCVFDPKNPRDPMVFICDEPRHAERIKKLVYDLAEVSVTPQKAGDTTVIKIEDTPSVIKILTLSGSYLKPYLGESPINPQITKKDCCKGAYIRTCFLINGFVTDPVKNYHMEFSDRDYSHAYGLKELITSLGIAAKIIKRKNRYVVYIKDSEQISDMLGITSAHLSLLKLENIKVIKEVRNNLNRKNNCETSNIAKTIKSSVREQNAIKVLRDTNRLKNLSPKLKEIAYLRLENPDSSYTELGRLLSPPLGKSGVYHRLQNIIKLAENEEK